MSATETRRFEHHSRSRALLFGFGASLPKALAPSNQGAYLVNLLFCSSTSNSPIHILSVPTPLCTIIPYDRYSIPVSQLRLGHSFAPFFFPQTSTLFLLPLRFFFFSSPLYATLSSSSV